MHSSLFDKNYNKSILESKSLFDILTCKCNLIPVINCKCHREKHIPPIEVRFLIDQRSDRLHYISILRKNILLNKV